MQHYKVTPWVVEGKVDYDKLVKEFGLKFIDDDLITRIKKHTKEINVMLRRKFFYAHRDLDLILDDYEKGRGFFLYTGRGPSGPMHIGHLIPFYFTKWLQEKFNVNLYIQITDDEKFLERELTFEDVQKWSYENILDIIAVGFDPHKTFIFKDTEYMGNIYRLAVKISRKINFSLVRAVFGFKESTNIGILFYPAIQIVPTFFEHKRCLIPAAIDQDPYWRIQRDLAEQFGYYKAAEISSKFLPPLTGMQGKMSASNPKSAIYLTDDEKTIKEKVMKFAFSGGQATIELHRKLGGDPNVDVSFQWLYSFFEEDDERIKRLEEDYKSGKLLSGELKQILIDKLLEFLQNHKERREEAKDKIHLFMYNGELAKKMWENKF